MGATKRPLSRCSVVAAAKLPTIIFFFTTAAANFRHAPCWELPCSCPNHMSVTFTTGCAYILKEEAWYDKIQMLGEETEVLQESEKREGANVVRTGW